MRRQAITDGQDVLVPVPDWFKPRERTDCPPWRKGILRVPTLYNRQTRTLYLLCESAGTERRRSSQWYPCIRGTTEVFLTGDGGALARVPPRHVEATDLRAEIATSPARATVLVGSETAKFWKDRLQREAISVVLRPGVPEPPEERRYLGLSRAEIDRLERTEV